MVEYSVISVLTGTILGFIAGTSLTWTSPEMPYLNSTDTGPFDGTLTDNQVSWIGGILSLAAAVGPFVYGFLADKIGRKYTLLAIAIPFAASSFITAFSKSVVELYVARFITGLGVGGTFTVLPMYVGEMSHNEHRGVLGSTMNVFICFGLIFTYVTGSYIKKILVFNIFLGGLAVAFFIVFLLLGRETPHWYVSKRKYVLAEQTIMHIRNDTKQEINAELEDLKKVIENEESAGYLDIFRSKGNTKAFLIGAGLVFFQQASGINAVLFFAQTIFKTSGTSLEPMYCSMIIGGVQFGTSFITPLVSNHFNRKLLLVFSGIGMCLSESLLGVYSIMDKNDHEKVSSLNFIPIVALVLYIITYNVGYGPLPWAIIGEIFPTNIKSPAGSLCTAVCWFTSFVITKWFSQIVEAVGQGQCFLGFAVASLVAAAFGQFVVLETRGKSLVQIQQDLNR